MVPNIIMKTFVDEFRHARMIRLPVDLSDSTSFNLHGCHSHDLLKDPRHRQFMSSCRQRNLFYLRRDGTLKKQ